MNQNINSLSRQGAERTEERDRTTGIECIVYDLQSARRRLQWPIVDGRCREASDAKCAWGAFASLGDQLVELHRQVHCRGGGAINPRHFLRGGGSECHGYFLDTRQGVCRQ